jgi:hypothetical protein
MAMIPPLPIVATLDDPSPERVALNARDNAVLHAAECARDGDVEGAERWLQCVHAAHDAAAKLQYPKR